ncbi:methyl-accepting chemotaxis protein [Vibrio sp. YMD68]|uniref:methyl-accepting chemotaxis protein n=1 Tax=Vibrio sp. YMD68 TaxID=3042300 RepID=UPI00249C492D|nr:methyl-accepting chemotaxis protein [Vibrio sp. YMD68]WGV99035.1 methyl-accepting chemotaxis protein [Vibrio sp. YMD68]
MAGSPRTTSFLQNVSIKAKLLTVVGTLIIGIVSYALYQQASFSTLEDIEKAAKQNQLSAIDLLTLRRHEKDFLSRKDPKYVTRFDETFEQLEQRVLFLQDTLSKYDSAALGQLTTITGTLRQYQDQFHQLNKQVSLLGMDQQSGLGSELNDNRLGLHHAVKQTQSAELEASYLALVKADFHYLIAPSQEAVLDFEEAINNFTSRSSAYTQVVTEMVRYQQSFQRFVAEYAVYGLSPQLGMRGALRTNVHKTEEAFHQLQESINAVVDRTRTQVKTKLYLFGTALAFIISTLLVIITTSITKRIGQITRLMKDISEGNGDLTVRMNSTGNDELAQLSNSFDHFVSKLHTNIKDIADVMHVLNECSLASKHIATESMNNAQQQKIESELVATAVNELVMTSNEITANIESAAENAHLVKQEADKSLDLTNDASNSLHILTSNIENSQQMVAELEKHSSEIHSVISTIQGIAEQTNLLALNAAIEAARAGENGRGFAVVADEVRQLSLMTNNSTQQIESTINGLTAGVKGTIDLMQNSLEQAHITNDKTAQAVSAIGLITEQISEMFDMNTQIATASEEQSMVSSDIDRNITQIADLAGSTYSTISESAECSVQVNQVGEKLERIVGEFKY